MKKLFIFILSLAIVFSASACAKDGQPQTSDILSQKAMPRDKINISVMVKYAFSINEFEKAVEEKFPNINIVQVGNYSYNMGTDEYYARMEHDDLTDIVMTWPMDTGKEYWSSRLIDLSTLSCTSKYTTKSLNDISKHDEDGKVYYLPGPSQVRGIVYNKTMFEKNNWQVPSDLDSFIELCQTIEESGIRSLQLGLKNSEVLDTAFVGYGYGESFSTPADAKALADFDNNKSSFADNYMPALETFQKLVDTGILKPKDLEIGYAKRETMLFNRQCAMVEDSVLLARMGESLTGITDEFALMPFFNEGKNNDWSRLYPVCFIGLNKHLQEEENQEKYQAALKIMDYISTEEGQNALMGDTGAMFSNLKGMQPPDIPEIAELTTSLNAGRYGVFPTLKNAQAALREGLAGMVSGDKTAQDVIQMVDEQNTNPVATTLPSIIGQASEDFTMVETGNYFTDTMRAEAKTDIALYMDNGKDGLYNGKGLSGRLYAGEITTADIARILPDLKHGEKGELIIVEMTGENLINTLEHSILVDNNVGGWFYYFSGLKMEYCPSATPGNRIRKITDDKGNEIDKNRTYTIAVMDEIVNDKYCISTKSTGKLIADIITQSFQNGAPISPAKDGRFTIII